MAKRDHTSEVRGRLTGQSLNTPDAEIYAGGFHEKAADQAIAIYETGGPVPDDMMGTTDSIQYPRIQVSVRAPAGKKDQGKSDADDVWRLLHDWSPSAYSRPQMLGSGVNFLGPDDDGRLKWSINLELFIDE